MINFIRTTQPKEFQNLQAQYGAETEQKLLARLSREITKRGTLDVLRKGIKDRGVKFVFAYFKPASGMNPQHQQLYQNNRFAVVRQLKSSRRNENAIDMVLFLNGIPIITAELKNSLTGQFVENAIKQYKTDRLPNGEPLLAFKRCLVHFAVGNEEVHMTTRLQGDKTHFLPFNKDTVNPVNPNGHKTHYLWEDIWQPATLLELIQNYLHVQKNTEKVFDQASGKLVENEWEVFIFPRYHQLDAVRKLLEGFSKKGLEKITLFSILPGRVSPIPLPGSRINWHLFTSTRMTKNVCLTPSSSSPTGVCSTASCRIPSNSLNRCLVWCAKLTKTLPNYVMHSKPVKPSLSPHCRNSRLSLKV